MMFARLLLSNGMTDYVTGRCVFTYTSPIWEFTFSFIDAIIIGVEFEGVYIRPINPPLITDKNTITSIQLKGDNVAVLVDRDIKQILQTPVKNLPLIMNELKTWSGKRLYEEKLKDTINTETLP